MKMLTSKWVFTMLLMLGMALPYLASAQRSISGKVVAIENGQTVSGASIVIKGTKVGAMTSPDGFFTINAKEGDVLLVSGVGIKTLEFKVGQSDRLLISVETEVGQLNEVVVTALGIKKESKRIGYSVQEVKGQDLIKAREPNAVTLVITGIVFLLWKA
jgi:hypothetical protein